MSICSLVPPVIWICTHTLRASGDAWYFHWQASFIANGAGWFISPFPYISHHAVVPSALHPPLWVLILSFADTIGLTSYPSQLLGASVIGAGAVFVTGLAAREVGGPRVGLIAAGLAALYPNYWINYGEGLSETLVLLLIAALILVSFKLWRDPSFEGRHPRRAVRLGGHDSGGAGSSDHHGLDSTRPSVPAVARRRRVRRGRDPPALGHGTVAGIQFVPLH